MPLNSDDPLFSTVRDVHVEQLMPFLQGKVRRILRKKGARKWGGPLLNPLQLETRFLEKFAWNSHREGFGGSKGVEELYK